MPPKNKIKIVDVVDVKNEDYTITNDEIEKSELPAENEQLETAEETTSNTQEKYDSTPEEITTDTTTPESTKKIREQQLVKCEKCGKFVTPKTLKYTHSLKCGVEKYSPGRPNKSEIKINENTQEEAPPNPVPIQKVAKDKPQHLQRTQPPKTVVKDVVKTFEEMRKERLSERLKRLSERNINLFKQVL